MRKVGKSDENMVNENEDVDGTVAVRRKKRKAKKTESLWSRRKRESLGALEENNRYHMK